MSEEKYAGMWDFSGACAPTRNADGTFSFPSGIYYETFTLGCFQWEKKSSGKKLKKGRVRYRVNGTRHDPQAAWDAAKAYCDKKNAQVAA